MKTAAAFIIGFALIFGAVWSVDSRSSSRRMHARTWPGALAFFVGGMLIVLAIGGVFE